MDGFNPRRRADGVTAAPAFDAMQLRTAALWLVDRMGNKRLSETERYSAEKELNRVIHRLAELAGAAGVTAAPAPDAAIALMWLDNIAGHLAMPDHEGLMYLRRFIAADVPQVVAAAGGWEPDAWAATEFYAAEALRVHELCDRRGIPRTTEAGERLSMAQRVEYMEVAYGATLNALLRAD